MTDINLSSFIWSVADLLRGDYKDSAPFHIVDLRHVLARFVIGEGGLAAAPGDRR